MSLTELGHGSSASELTAREFPAGPTDRPNPAPPRNKKAPTASAAEAFGIVSPIDSGR